MFEEIWNKSEPFPLFRLQLEDLCDRSVRCILFLERSRMGADAGLIFWVLRACQIVRTAGNTAGVWVTSSDTIHADSRVSFAPFWNERRQTEHAATRSTPIPCFRRPHCKQLPFGYQPVAAVREARLWQLNCDHIRPEKAGSKMASCTQVSSRLYGLPLGIPLTEEAAFAASPEVRKCR